MSGYLIGVCGWSSSAHGAWDLSSCAGSRKKWVVQGLKEAQVLLCRGRCGVHSCGFLVLANKTKLCFERKHPCSTHHESIRTGFKLIFR